MSVKIRDTIEIEITTDRNLECFNCDRSCKQALSEEYIIMKQIKPFLKESFRCFFI